jgi:hypothetical protein
MSRYLNEKEVGFDPSCIGFPNLGDCMAVALQTREGLWGFHMMPGDQVRSAAFKKIIDDSGRPRGAVHLYGTCYLPKRFPGMEVNGAQQSSKTQWKTEMTSIARMLNYRGPVSGFDTSNWTADIDRKETTYVEYRLAGQTCRTYYKRMSKMTAVTGQDDSKNPIQQIRTLPSGQFTTKTPYLGHVTSDVSIKPTESNEGKLHEVSYFGTDTFSVQ